MLASSSNVVSDFEASIEDIFAEEDKVAVRWTFRAAFNRLQDFDGDQDAIVFYAFDLPLTGRLDLRRQPLDTRCNLLREAVDLMPAEIRLSETFGVPAAALGPGENKGYGGRRREAGRQHLSSLEVF